MADYYEHLGLSQDATRKDDEPIDAELYSLDNSLGHIECLAGRGLKFHCHRFHENNSKYGRGRANYILAVWSHP